MNELPFAVGLSPGALGEMHRTNGIVGTWQLQSWSVETAAHERWHPLGEAVNGQLLYAPSGHMAVSMTRATRKPLGFSADDLVAASRGLRRIWHFARAPKSSLALTKYIGAALGYVSYAGSYRVHGNTVFHDITVALVPDMIGTTVERAIAFDGDRLVLSATSALFSQSLTWSPVASVEP